jgi:uncharacterized membrane protein
MEKKQTATPNQRKELITLFMIMIFSILLAATSGIDNTIVRWFFDALLFIGQLFVVKAILDDVYK